MTQTKQLSQSKQKLQNGTKLQLAKRQLNSIQQKFKKFKSKSRQHTQRQSYDSRIRRQDKKAQYNTANKAESTFLPDLKQYFSFMMDKQNISGVNNLLNEKDKLNDKQLQKSSIKLQINEKLMQEKLENRNKRTIQQKLMQQKSQAINNLQNFFMNKKSQLQSRISQLEQSKIKAIQDINLLKRNNAQIQSQIQMQKNMIFSDVTQSLKEKNKQIYQKIMKKKQNIQTMKKDVDKIKRRKDQLKRNINDCLKGNKNFIIKDKLTNQL